MYFNVVVQWTHDESAKFGYGGYFVFGTKPNHHWKKRVLYIYTFIKDTYLVDGIDNTDTSRSELKISKKRKATSFGDANVLSLLQ